ncbi:MAG: DUF6485 family protein [Anaerovorax sp.]
MSSSKFCPCTDFSCEFNPNNHNQGCNLCVEDSVKNKEIPKCFFMKINPEISDIEDWSFQGFVDFYNKHSK